MQKNNSNKTLKYKILYYIFKLNTNAFINILIFKLLKVYYTILHKSTYFKLKIIFCLNNKF